MKKLSALIALSLCAAASSSAYAQTCASASPITSNSVYTSDTTGTTNWMVQFGPLGSPANDMLYTFVAGAQPLGTITPTASSYTFAMYLIPSCSDTGSEPVPIRSTATVGGAITLADPPPPGQPSIVAGNTYYLAVTGTAAGGATANGTVTFGTTILPVTLQSFEVN
jgi:hypothetical protein